MRPALALLVALLLAPIAAAAGPFESEILLVDLRDEGTLSGEGSYGEPGSDLRGELRIDVEWRVEGALEMIRGAPWNEDVYQSVGEVRLVASGTYDLVLVSGDSESSGTCTLDFDDSVLHQSFLVVRDGKLSMSNQRIVLHEWDCQGDAVMVGVPAIGFAASRADDAASGAFPASLAADILFAGDEAGWTGLREGSRRDAVLSSGLIEGEAKLGAQTIPFAHTFALGSAFGNTVCGEAINPSHLPDVATCAIESTATLDIRASSFDDPPADPPADPEDEAAEQEAGLEVETEAATKGAPGPGALLALGAVALAMMARRRV